MASVENRSRFTVSVKHRPDLTIEFPHTRRSDAIKYLESLRDKGYKPAIARADDNLWVRIRGKGCKATSVPASSYDEAERIIQRIEAEQRNGLFIDYRAGHLVTGAELMLEYLEKEVPKHRGKDVEKYTIQGWVDDRLGVLLRQHQARERAILAGGAPDVVKARRLPRRNLEGCRSHSHASRGRTSSRTLWNASRRMTWHPRPSTGSWTCSRRYARGRSRSRRFTSTGTR